MSAKGNTTGPAVPVPGELPKNHGGSKSVKPVTEGTGGKSLDPKRFPKA